MSGHGGKNGNESEASEETTQIFDLFVFLSSESRRVTKAVARQQQLTGPQLETLKELEKEDALSLSTLSEKLRAQNSTVTGIVDRMERDGLVVRTRSKDDRRVVHLHLTRKGRDAARAVPKAPFEMFQQSIGTLDHTEAKELRRLLQKVADHVQMTLKKQLDAEDA
jgi:DNA-binding MarR family transcriptional regulator